MKTAALLATSMLLIGCGNTESLAESTQAASWTRVGFPERAGSWTVVVTPQGERVFVIYGTSGISCTYLGKETQ